MEGKNYNVTINGLSFSLVDDRLIAKSVELTKLEQRALVVLIQNGNEVTSKRRFTELVWGHVHVSDSSLRKLISLLRQKLNDTNGDILVTERGSGYRLNFKKEAHFSPPRYTSAAVIAFTLLISVIGAFIAGKQLNEAPTTLSPIQYDWIASFDKAILRYQKHDDAYYILTDDILRRDSAIVQVKNGVKKEVYRSKDPGAYLLDFSISSGGKSLVRVSHSEHCEVTVFDDLFTTVHSTLPCYKFMPASQFHWLNEDSFLFTHKADATKSVRPAIYDLTTKSINKFSDWPINYENVSGQDDVMILPYKDGFFTVRNDDLTYRSFSLQYFTQKYKKDFDIETFRNIIIDGDSFYRINSDDQVQVADLHGIEQDDFKFEFETLINSSPLYSYQPQQFNHELHFITGSWNKFGLYTNSSETMVMEINVDDSLSSTSRGLMVLQPHHYGYRILELEAEVTTSVVVKTDLEFTFANFFDGQYLLAGNDGLYSYSEGRLTPIYTKPVSSLAVANRPIFESEDSVFRLTDSLELDTLAIGVRSLTQTQSGYFYVERLGGGVVNQAGDIIANASNHQYLFSVDDRAVTGKRTKNGSVDIIDITNSEIVASLDYPLVNFNLVQHGDDVYYTSGAKTNNTIVKIVNSGGNL